LNVALPVVAAEGDTIYHALQLELDGGQSDHGDSIVAWDFDGWIGGDDHKLALKSEAEREAGVTAHTEFWAMYSRNIATFWDAQIGLRHDTQANTLTYLVFGIEGLARYFFETEVHLFISDAGDLSARIRQENDLLLTQRLIAQPYFEAELYARDVPELEVGAGLADAEIGLQTRYEFTRDWALYLDLRYERKFGETSSIARDNGEDNDAVIGVVGFKLLF